MSAAIEAEQLRPSQLKRRGRVIAAALELGAEGGYDAVQMRDVAVPRRRRPGHDLPLLLVEGPRAGRGHAVEWTGALRTALRSRRPRATRRPTSWSTCSAGRAGPWSGSPSFTTASSRPSPRPTTGVAECTQQVGNQIASITDEILAELDPRCAERISRVIRHVWYATSRAGPTAATT